MLNDLCLDRSQAFFATVEGEYHWSVFQEDNAACLKFAKLPKLSPLTNNRAYCAIGLEAKCLLWKLTFKLFLQLINLRISSQKVSVKRILRNRERLLCDGRIKQRESFKKQKK